MSRRPLSMLQTSDLLPAPGPAPARMSLDASPQRCSPPDASHSGRLRKEPPSQTHGRSVSATTSTTYLPDAEPTLPTLQDLQQAPSAPLPPPPAIIGDDGPYSRSSSRAGSSRPGTPNTYSRPTTPVNVLAITGRLPSASPGQQSEKQQKKHRGLFGRGKKDDEPRGPVAWIAGHPQRLPYDVPGLLAGRPMSDLWDEQDGNCLVSLFPRGAAGKGPSFRIDSAVLASSPVLTKMAFGDLYSSNPNADRRQQQMPVEARTQALSLTDYSTPPPTPPKTKPCLDTMSSTSSRASRDALSSFSDAAPEIHLYIPVKLASENPQVPVSQSSLSKRDPPQPDSALDDLQTLVDIRNFFAFLCGGALVATERKPTWFSIFMSIAGILKTYAFANVDASTYGEVASNSFDNYVEELGLSDVRASREKTIEGIVLGEHMKSVLLYNESFTHAVGKYDDLVKMNSPKFALISPITQNRLVRASMDLEKRVQSVQLTLSHFDFPSLFSGLMNSKVSAERKEGVRFDEWKDACYGMRKWTIAVLQQRYGHWPPKASSKKNDLETSGLNRLVLRDLYHDMTAIYDLLVDRTNLTTRTVSGIDLAGGQMEDATVRALRAVLSESDRSSPPVKPPIPFDVPRLPDLRAARPDYGTSGDKKKDLKSWAKKLKDDEVVAILRACSNPLEQPDTPFVTAFREMERRAARHATIAKLIDLRLGQWLFMYVVLQSLPMLVCDAPTIKHGKGVEYFLCEPPRSGVPWANPNAGPGAAGAGSRRTWFSVGGEAGGAVVSLPSDVVEHGVEGIYRRSHCWVMAEKWSEGNPILNEALHEQEAMSGGGEVGGMASDGRPLDLPPPTPGLLAPGGSRSSSPMGYDRSKRHSSLGLGLEALPFPVGVTPDGRPASAAADGRPQSVHSVDASKTFDVILAGLEGQKKGGKRK